MAWMCDFRLALFVTRDPTRHADEQLLVVPDELIAHFTVRRDMDDVGSETVTCVDLQEEGYVCSTGLFE